MTQKLPPNNKPLSAQLLEFSGMAFEMLIIIGIFVFLGRLIDKKVILQLPIFTIIFSLLGLAVSFYQVFKRLQKK